MREEGRIQQVSVVVATAVNADGKREVLGIDVGASEDGPSPARPTCLGIDDGATGKWRVNQLVVVSGEVFTLGFRELPVPVITLAHLRDKLVAVGGVAHPRNGSAR